MVERSHPWRAALPMYVAPAEVQAASQEWLRESLALLGLGADLKLPEGDLVRFWRDPDLLLGQTCGYPLMTQLRGQVRVIGRPLYRLPDSRSGFHCSLLVVRRDDPRSSLEAFRDSALVINAEDSNTGMNLLRHRLLSLQEQGRFFASVAVSGAHRQSLREVVAGRADISAVDSVTWHYLTRFSPRETAELKVIGQTAPSPTLPLISSLAVSDQLASELIVALNESLKASARLRNVLSLDGVLASDEADYQCLLDYQQQAIDANYPSVR